MQRRKRAAEDALRLVLSACVLCAVARAATLKCKALPAPGGGASMTYYKDDAGTVVVKPRWCADTHAHMVHLRTLAVVRCPPGMDLLVGNRTQPTGTFNRTCWDYMGQVAFFDPPLLDGITISCRSPARPIPLSADRCGKGQALCGSMNCCPVGDTCVPKGLQGWGLCCPKGTSPCGDELCCNAGEKCNGNKQAPKCCSKGATPCGTEACCNAGEQCFPTIAGGRGVCCPGGSGYSPCISWESQTLSDGQAWHCCDAGKTCTLSLKEQEAWSPSVDAPGGSCRPTNSTRCGPNWCSPQERCISTADGTCVLKVSKPCGPSQQPCAPGNCLSSGTCCPLGTRPCGNGSCCGQQDTCWPKALGGQGLCCAPGAEPRVIPRPGTNDTVTQCCLKGAATCGTSCCRPGELCNQKAAATGWDLCCPAGSTPCGRDTCCRKGSFCAELPDSGRGICCPDGTKACGLSCCGAGTQCVVSERFSGGVCCGAGGSQVCGSTCCLKGTTCEGGKCVQACRAGDVRCGDRCCQAGFTCCGNGNCCHPVQKCSNGQCVLPTCPAGTEVCGGGCCAKGQLCSADSRRCCSKRDVACLSSGLKGYVQCGEHGSMPCKFWDQTCFELGHSAPQWRQQDFYCCANGTAPCPNAKGQCCPPGHPCLPAGVLMGPGEKACCAPGELPCGAECCGKDQWCAQRLFNGPPWDRNSLDPTCLSRKTHRQCGQVACPVTHTCYSSAGWGMGLCCPPGQKACRGTDRSGDADWSYCC